ncbi:MAG: LVIVD repeat-containing protein [Leadbetterella sp.]
MKTKLYTLIAFIVCVSCEGDSLRNGTSADTYSTSGVDNSGGRGGSTARFTIVNDYLYTVDNNTLKAFNISDVKNPTLTATTQINALAETIFPFKNHLLIGTRTGMFIYNLNTPEKPQYLSNYTHFVSCDPVVAEGNYAYVTLRNGTPCQRGQNQLDVLDISNLSKPTLIKSYQMINPHGLGTNKNILFICEGNNGLKVLDKSDPFNIKEIQFLKDIKSVDVIPLTDRLIVTGDGGIRQFEYTQKGEMKLLSKINIENE